MRVQLLAEVLTRSGFGLSSGEDILGSTLIDLAWEESGLQGEDIAELGPVGFGSFV